MQTTYIYPLLAFALLSLSGCSKQKQTGLTPWGESITVKSANGTFSLGDIQESGEMIMLTMSGPDTYFEYHGKSLGTQFLICEKFAQELGVSLRVETCKSTDEMIKRLNDGDADIIAYQIPKSQKGVLHCGYSESKDNSWVVKEGNSELADTLNRWFKPDIAEKVRKEERYLFSAQSIHRHVYAPMLNTKTGTISQYDHLFMRYAQVARWDWRLLAAQCYQESCFDPKAYSWAGARGLMQIMPSTAAHLGLPEEKMYDPEENIYAATRYIAELGSHFTDIRNPIERQMFVLASYNGGFFHIRDAMSLAKKNGKDPQRWNDVAEYVLKLSTPQYYNDPVVKHGYMRGQETVAYVERISSRWRQYRGMARGVAPIGPSFNFSPESDTPHRASHKHRFRL